MPVLLNLKQQPYRIETQQSQTIHNIDMISVSRPSSSSTHTSNHSIDSPQSNRDPDTKVRKNFFPHKLMHILSSPFFSDCVSWTRRGTAFFIENPDEFSKKYASYYQIKTTPRKESFARKLNRWGFKMELAKGPHCGSYSHQLFNKNEAWRCEDMSCNKKRGLVHSESSDSLESEDYRSAKKAKYIPERESRGLDMYGLSKMWTLERQMVDKVCSPQSMGTDDFIVSRSFERKDKLPCGESLLSRDLQAQLLLSLLSKRRPMALDHETIMKNAMMALI